MTGVWGLDAIVLPLVERICDMKRPFGPSKALAFVKGKRVLGGVVFNNWEPEHGVIEVTVGSLSPRWLTRSILKQVTEYVYNDCGCHAMFARTTADNPSVKIWRALGAEEREIPHLMGRGKAQTVFVLTDEAWNNSKFKR